MVAVGKEATAVDSRTVEELDDELVVVLVSFFCMKT
jgi:hypothetical protein